MALKAGDWVEIRSKQEILASLDADGCLDGLPFMPEMFQYCGRRFSVYKRAHKTCDTVTGTGGRRLPDAVHLNLRCDGKAHGNCEAACLLFWKEAWLRSVDETLSAETTPLRAATTERPNANAGCSELAVYNATCRREMGEIRYVCQATELPRYTSRLRRWDVRQYVEDYRSGNATVPRLLRGFTYACFSELCYRMSRFAPTLQWLYDRFQAIRGGIPYPRRAGTIPFGKPTPSLALNLRPGDLVRVKSYEHILETLDSSNKNAGLFFDAELVPYCGGIYRVRARINHFIDESSGRMTSLKTPAVILEGVWCQSRYSSCRMFCPRSIYSWWREVWLERVPEEARAAASAPGVTKPNFVGEPISTAVARSSSEPEHAAPVR